MNKAFICICVLTLSSLSANAREINVADHGILPGQDVTLKLNQLIESIGKEKGVTLSFPKGQYDFYPDYAVEKYRYVANHDNGLKRMAFPLFNARNITIDGGESLFMFHGRIVPFTVDGSRNVTLKNFSIDFIRSFHAELKVVESDPQSASFSVTTDPVKHPYKIENGEILFERYNQWDPIGSNIVFDPQTRSPIFDTRKYRVNSKTAKVTAEGPGRFKIENAVKVPPPVGSMLIVYGVHPTSRLVPGIHVTNSKNLKIENVTVHDAGGMALIVERTENIHLNRFKVTSAEGRYVATRADATHFIGCKGTIKMENSVLEHMLDDGINVHGAYVNIDRNLGDNQFLASISHFQQMGLVFGEPGDKVAILSRETVLPFYKTSIIAVKVLNEKRFLVTLADVPDTLPDGPLSLENLTWAPDVILRNNKIRENRARSALITTKGKVLIENNTFNSQMHGILIEGDNKFWYESGAVEDVTIRNNTFVNSGFGGGAAYPLLASPMLTDQQRTGEGHYHKNINFTGNKLISFNGLIALAKSVDGLNISNNTIEFSSDYPEVSDYPAIDLTYTDNAKIKKNTVVGFSRQLEVQKSDDSGTVKLIANDGIEEAKQ